MELSRVVLNIFGGWGKSCPQNLLSQASLLACLPFPSTHDFTHLLQEESLSMRTAPTPRSWMLRSMPFDFLPISSTGTGLCCPTQPWPMTSRGFTFMTALRPPRRVSMQPWLLGQREPCLLSRVLKTGPSSWWAQGLEGTAAWFGDLPHFQFGLGCVVPQPVHQEFPGHWQVTWGNEGPREEEENEAWDGAGEVAM